MGVISRWLRGSGVKGVGERVPGRSAARRRAPDKRMFSGWTVPDEVAVGGGGGESRG